MGVVIRFRRVEHVDPPLPVALVQAWSGYWAACSAAWWRWVLTGR